MITAQLTGGRGTLPADAAASIHRIDAQIGRRVQITEAGRTWARQLHLYNGWAARLPGFNRALHPSDPLANHVLLAGRRGAVDSDEQTGVPWGEHGWILTAGDEPWMVGSADRVIKLSSPPSHCRGAFVMRRGTAWSAL